jgi:signal transduction histidine kinase
MAQGGSVRTFVQFQKRLAAQVGEIATDLNQLAHELHPSKVDTLGLERSIRALCVEFSNRRKINASFAHGALPRSIDPNVSLCLYRITQEALHNVFRHSRARSVLVRLGSARGVLSLQVADDGVGFDASREAPSGLGLISMRERVALLGGTLQIHSIPQAGTRITATVQLPQDARRSPQNRDV